MAISAPEPEKTPPRADGSICGEERPVEPALRVTEEHQLRAVEEDVAVRRRDARRHLQVALGEQARPLNLVDGALPAVRARGRRVVEVVEDEPDLRLGRARRRALARALEDSVDAHRRHAVLGEDVAGAVVEVAAPVAAGAVRVEDDGVTAGGHGAGARVGDGEGEAQGLGALEDGDAVHELELAAVAEVDERDGPDLVVGRGPVHPLVLVIIRGRRGEGPPARVGRGRLDGAGNPVAHLDELLGGIRRGEDGEVHDMLARQARGLDLPDRGRERRGGGAQGARGWGGRPDQRRDRVVLLEGAAGQGPHRVRDDEGVARVGPQGEAHRRHERERVRQVVDARLFPPLERDQLALPVLRGVGSMSRSCTLAAVLRQSSGVSGSVIGSMASVKRKYPAAAGEKPSKTPVIALMYVSRRPMCFGL